MDNELGKAVLQSCAMNGGEGPHSYARNSSGQRMLIEAAKNIVQKAIASKFDFWTLAASSKYPICIADMGCSTGPNTFIAVQCIIEAIELQYQSQGLATPEFQVFFNDQVSNDFNTLFKTLPSNKNYFAAGVPGSFYGRLFPTRILHIVHSSASLNWMSKVPESITDKKSAAWNKGRIHYLNAPNDVVDAYASQYQMDLETFLHARAQEVAGNGLMVLQIPAAHDIILDSDIHPFKDLELLGTCLVDMAMVGLISEEKVDSFNLPIFSPPVKDLKEIFQRNEYFTVEQMEAVDLKHSIIHSVHIYVSHRRAALEGPIQNHFGDGIIDELFDRFTKKVMEFPDIMDTQKIKSVILFVLLKRKANA